MHLEKRTTIGEKLYAGMGVLLLLTVLEGGVALWGSARVAADIHSVTHALRGAAAHARHLYLAVQDRKQREEHAVGRSRQRPGAVCRREEEEPGRVRGRQRRPSTRCRVSLAGTSDQAVATTLRQKLDEWKALHAQIVELGDTGRVAEALETLNKKATPLFRSAEESAAVDHEPDVQGHRRRDAVAVELAVAHPDGAGHRGRAAGRRAGGVAGPLDQQQPARHVAGARRGRPAGRGGVGADVRLGAVDVAGRRRAGGLARGDLGVDGRDCGDDAHQRRQLAAGRGVDGRGRARARSVEPVARRHGRRDEQHQGIEQPRLEDHQDHRRDRLPDQHPRAQRRGRSGARRRGRHGLRRGGRRSAQPGAAIGAGGARHHGADRRRDRQLQRGQPARGAGRRIVCGHHRSA